MFYKLNLLQNGNLEVIEVVDAKPTSDDGFIYASEEEYKKLDPLHVINQLDIKDLLNS